MVRDVGRRLIRLGLQAYHQRGASEHEIEAAYRYHRAVYQEL